MRRVLAWLVVLLALGGAGYWFYTRLPEPAGQEAGGRRRGGGDPVPVLVAKAEQRDVPVFLDGLGTVQAFNTVTVNSSVTRVVVGSTGSRLLTFNEHPHLTPDTLTYR